MKTDFKSALDGLNRVMNGTQNNRSLGFVAARNWPAIKEALEFQLRKTVGTK